MKRDVYIIAAILFVAVLGVGGVFWWQMTLPADNGKAPVKPRTEPVAALPKKEEPKENEVVPVPPPKKSIRVEKKALEPKIEVKEPTPPMQEPTPIEKKKEAPAEPKIELKVEPKVVVKAKPPNPPATKVIVLDNLIKINDPEGEFEQLTINGGKTIVLLGVVKSLKIAGLNEKSILDATRLEAHEIIFTGHLNGGSKALLGKAKHLVVRDVNDRSTLEAADLGAKVIHVDGAVNGMSRLKLHAPGGVVEFRGELNDRAQIDVAAPDGKVVFKGRADAAINGGATIHVVAKELELAGAVNGPDTSLDVTLTRNGALKFRRINGGVRLHYRKSAFDEPELRIDMGALDARAVFREVPTIKK